MNAMVPLIIPPHPFHTIMTEPTAKLSIHSLRSLNKIQVELGSPFTIYINQAALHTGLGDV